MRSLVAGVVLVGAGLLATIALKPAARLALPPVLGRPGDRTADEPADDRATSGLRLPGNPLITRRAHRRRVGRDRKLLVSSARRIQLISAYVAFQQISVADVS